jgi:N-acetylglucosaminyldiphosphoundecaprenol N-acetyl-beta-D-mannosaminyltransferase
VDEAIRNTGLRDALKKAHLVCADGMSIVWGGRFLGCPEVEPLPGEELMDYLCAAGDARGDSIFLLGAMPGVAELAAAKLKEQYPGLRIAGVASPPVGFERDRVELDRIREQLKAAAPMLLFVGFGAPKQEIWMRDELPGLPVGAALAVGAAIDTTAGLRKASPIWMKRRGIAWIYRLVHEPRRLWRRYLFGNSRFVATVMAAWLTQRLERFQLNN